MARKVQPPVKRGTPCPTCGEDEWKVYGRSWRCAPCNRSRWRESQGKIPNPVRLMRQRYGITPEEFDTMLRAQRGRCAICGEPMGGRGPMIDHCHETREVRGLLCQHCNTLLGAARDLPERLLAARDYLLRHHPERFANAE